MFKIFKLWEMLFNQILWGATFYISENDVISGARSTDDLIADRRKYNFSDKIIWKEKTHAPFLTILNRKLAKYKVTDPEPKVMQDGYTKIVFTLNNDAATAATFEFADADAKLMQAGDSLMLLESLAAQTNFATQLAEVAIVQSVGAAGGGPSGTGYTSVTVERGALSTTAVDVATAANWRCIHGMTTYAEGAGIGESKNVEVETETNYTEILKMPYEVTGTFDKTDYYGPVDMQYKARKARRDFFRILEWKFWFGRKGKVTEAGKPKRFSGGVHEFIYGAATGNMQDLGTDATPTEWNTALQDVFVEGNETKWMFNGPQAMTKMDNAFTGQASVYTKNEQLSKQYLIKVKTLDSSHGILNIVREQAFADVPAITNSGFIVDIDYFNYMYLNGRDFQILKNVQTNDKDSTKNALFGEIGLHRSFGTAHHFCYDY